MNLVSTYWWFPLLVFLLVGGGGPGGECNPILNRWRMLRNRFLNYSPAAAAAHNNNYGSSNSRHNHYRQHYYAAHAHAGKISSDWIPIQRTPLPHGGGTGWPSTTTTSNKTTAEWQPWQPKKKKHVTYVLLREPTLNTIVDVHQKEGEEPQVFLTYEPFGTTKTHFDLDKTLPPQPGHEPTQSNELSTATGLSGSGLVEGAIVADGSGGGGYDYSQLLSALFKRTPSGPSPNESVSVSVSTSSSSVSQHVSSSS